ncbi:hypothetical protein ACIA47_32315 [Micromonospora sp. NPDC051227]|uniref:hypothetical protein n=1 Tax=Micromonospora sp. NPDC051227 TaxID=3364285 RepID=UPI0037BCADF9
MGSLAHCLFLSVAGEGPGHWKDPVDQDGSGFDLPGDAAGQLVVFVTSSPSGTSAASSNGAAPPGMPGLHEGRVTPYSSIMASPRLVHAPGECGAGAAQDCLALLLWGSLGECGEGALGGRDRVGGVGQSDLADDLFGRGVLQRGKFGPVGCHDSSVDLDLVHRAHGGAPFRLSRPRVRAVV